MGGRSGVGLTPRAGKPSSSKPSGSTRSARNWKPKRSSFFGGINRDRELNTVDRAQARAARNQDDRPVRLIVQE